MARAADVHVPALCGLSGRGSSSIFRRWTRAASSTRGSSRGRRPTAQCGRAVSDKRRSDALLSVALSRQMTEAFNAHSYTAQQKQDTHDYYVIVRASSSGRSSTSRAPARLTRMLAARSRHSLARSCSKIRPSIRRPYRGTSCHVSVSRTSYARFRRRWPTARFRTSRRGVRRPTIL